jgi:hypothetical protein
MKAVGSLNGIIAHLTRKCGGNVREGGFVTISAKSVDDDPRCQLGNVAGLESDSAFSSNNEPGQWVCWDFGALRVRLGHYTIVGSFLRSSVVEGSVDGANWVEVDRRNNCRDCEVVRAVSFAASKSVECRFIRLTQTAKKGKGGTLSLTAVEFFGHILE